MKNYYSILEVSNKAYRVLKNPYQLKLYDIYLLENMIVKMCTQKKVRRNKIKRNTFKPKPKIECLPTEITELHAKKTLVKPVIINHVLTKKMGKSNTQFIQEICINIFIAFFYYIIIKLLKIQLSSSSVIFVSLIVIGITTCFARFFVRRYNQIYNIL
jgi:hypothetical protein